MDRHPFKSSFRLLLILSFLTVFAIGLYFGATNAIKDRESEFEIPTPTLFVLPTEPVGSSSADLLTTPSLSSPTPANENSISHFFSSSTLGISFTYADKTTTLPNAAKVGVKEIGNSIYVYFGTMNPTSGQSVEIFEKDPLDSLSLALEKKFLAETSPNSCTIKLIADNTLPNGYSKAVLTGSECPEKYRADNGISFFLADSGHPEKFVFFSIGQYSIPSETGTATSWQDTLTFL